MTDPSEPSLTLETVLARADGLLEAEIDGETVMMSIDRGRYYGLDVVGSEIWALLETPRSVAQICATLRQRYEVEPEVCESDVLAFLGDLLADGSVRRVES